MDPYVTIQEQLRLAAEAGAKPWNDNANDLVQLALANRNRQWQLQDIASNQDFDKRMMEKRWELASEDEKKRFELAQKAADEAEKRQLLLAAAKDNIDLGIAADDLSKHTPASLGQLYVSKAREKIQANAKAALKGFDIQLDLARKSSEDAEAVLKAVGSDSGSLQAKREALIATLADPASKYIADDDRQRLLGKVNKATTPEEIQKAVDDTVNHMQQNYWFRKGKAFDQASAFYNTYTTQLQQRVGPELQVKLQAANANLNARLAEEKTIWGEAAKHLQSNLQSGTLDSATVDDWIGKHGERHAVPTDPNEVLGKKPKAKPETKPEPPPTTQAIPADTRPPLVSAALPPTPPLAETASDRGLIGATQQVYNTASNPVYWGEKVLPLAEKLNNLPGAVADFFVGRGRSGNIGQVVPPQIVQGPVNRGTGVPLDSWSQGVPSDKPMAATQDEVDKVMRLAQDYGVTPERMAAGQDAIRAGDPTAIKTFNMLLMQVRTMNPANPAPNTASQPFMPASVPTYR